MKFSKRLHLLSSLQTRSKTIFTKNERKTLLCLDGGDAGVVVRVKGLEGRVVGVAVVVRLLLQSNGVHYVAGIRKFDLKSICN